ncbi:MAG: nucleotidyltransferase domain-containing protein [Anaerolineae bacterium]
MSVSQDPNRDAWPALEAAQAYTETLKRHFGDRLVSVVLYGSVARNEHTPTSDIDLLIVAQDLPPSHRARNRLLAQLEEQLVPLLASLRRRGVHTDFSTIIKTPEEARRFTPLYLDLTKDAILLYDQEGFFQGILDQLQARLSALGARRVRQGNVRYWKLKPDYRWGEVIEI